MLYVHSRGAGDSLHEVPVGALSPRDTGTARERSLTGEESDDIVAERE
jgi:hypothetical protein